MKIKRTILLAAAATAVFASPAIAESIRLDKLKRADMVALQRGQSVADAACAEAIIEEIKAYGGKAATRDFYIDVEANPIVISSKKLRIKHECKDGVHTMHDNGKKMVLQKYDENGEPTLMHDN